MPAKGELLVKNHEGNDLAGPRENGSSFIFEFNHEVFLPYDREENKMTGSRKVDAFTVIKDINQLTPQLYDMCANGRKCTEVKIILYRTAETGEEEEYFHYILEEARIVSVKNYMPNTKIDDYDNMGHLEEVKFLARKFTWAYLDGGIEYTEESL